MVGPSVLDWKILLLKISMEVFRRHLGTQGLVRQKYLVIDVCFWFPLITECSFSATISKNLWPMPTHVA